MRRLFLIVMMLLLPIQSGWAVAASVCAHETGTATHFGHHEHQHQQADAVPGQEDAQADAQPADAQPGGYHADCGVCHGLGSVVFSAEAQVASAWAEREFTAFYSVHLPDPPVEAFLRPPLSLVG